MREDPCFSLCQSVCGVLSVHKFSISRSPYWSLWDSTPTEGSNTEWSCDERCRGAHINISDINPKVHMIMHLTVAAPCARVCVCRVPVAPLDPVALRWPQVVPERLTLQRQFIAQETVLHRFLIIIKKRGRNYKNNNFLLLKELRAWSRTSPRWAGCCRAVG